MERDLELEKEAGKEIMSIMQSFTDAGAKVGDIMSADEKTLYANDGKTVLNKFKNGKWQNG